MSQVLKLLTPYDLPPPTQVIWIPKHLRESGIYSLSEMFDHDEALRGIVVAFADDNASLHVVFWERWHEGTKLSGEGLPRAIKARELIRYATAPAQTAKHIYDAYLQANETRGETS